MSSSMHPISPNHPDSRAELDLVVSSVAFAIAIALAIYVGRTAGASQLMGFGLLALLLWFRHLPELTHPLVWFVPPFTIYSISYPMLGVIGLHKYDTEVARVVALHAFALVGFALTCIWSVRRHPRDVVLRQRESQSATVTLAGLLIIAPITIALLGVVYVSGAQTKRQIIDSGGIAAGLAEVSLWLTVLFGMLCMIVRISRGQRFFWVASLTITVAILALLVMGERDVMLRFVLVSVLVAWDRKRRPSMTMAFTVGVIGFVSLPALQAMKAIAIGNPFVYEFDFFVLFDQEFRSMGKNSWVVLSDSGFRSIHGLDVLMIEVTRIFASDLLGIHGQSMTAWYNEAFYGSPAAGKGFSLVAVSYLLGGAPGVFGVYALLGAVMSWLYRRRCKSVYAFSVYVFSVPVFIYAQRADISNFAGPLLKFILLPIMAIAIATELLMRKKSLQTQSQINGEINHARP